MESRGRRGERLDTQLAQKKSNAGRTESPLMFVGPSPDADVQLSLVIAAQTPVAPSPDVGSIEVVTTPGRSVQASGRPFVQRASGEKTATVCPRGPLGQ